MKHLKGKRGTQVTVAVFRRGFSELLDFLIVRDVIPTYSIDIAYMVDDSIGYVKVSKFSATTYEEFADAIDKLKELDHFDVLIQTRHAAKAFRDDKT